KAVWRALDPLEEERGRADLLVGHVRDRAHLLVAAHLLGDPLELADRLDPRDPVAQVSRAQALGARSALGSGGGLGGDAHLLHGVCLRREPTGRGARKEAAAPATP